MSKPEDRAAFDSRGMVFERLSPRAQFASLSARAWPTARGEGRRKGARESSHPQLKNGAHRDVRRWSPGRRPTCAA